MLAIIDEPTKEEVDAVIKILDSFEDGYVKGFEDGYTQCYADKVAEDEVDGSDEIAEDEVDGSDEDKSHNS